MPTELEKETINEEISKAQLQKLRLEVISLQKSKGLGAKIINYIPILSAIIAVSGFLLGIYSLNIQKEKDYKQVFWSKQLQIYDELSTTTARLATLENQDDVNKEYQHFKELYHGPAVMYMDDNVANELKNFIELYIDYISDKRLQVKVQGQSRILAHACRVSLQENWNIPLKELDLSRFK